MNRRHLILFILIIIFVIAALWSYSAVPRPKTVSRLTYAPGQSAKPATLSTKASPREAFDGHTLNIPLLERDQVDFKGYRRNIFRPVFVDEQKLLKQKAAAFKPQQLPPVQPQRAATAAPQPQPQPDAAALARFTFLGFLKKDAQQIIFLGKDNEVILVKKGDKVSGRYEATAITDQALTLLATDTGAEIVIPLIENRPLAATR